MKDDRLAAALGNASLLGVGYLLLRRWRLAALAVLITAVLAMQLLVTRAVWSEIALVVWWVAVIVHGWVLAGKPGLVAASEQRLIALCVTVPVLFAAVVLRVEAVGIQHEVADARAAGDCAGVKAAQQKSRFGDRLADAPGIEKLGADIEACNRLAEIAARLRTKDVSVEEEFRELSAVLASKGQDRTVEKVLDEYLGTLGEGGPCPTAKLATWLRDRPRTNDVLDKANKTGDELVPAAQFACAQSEAKAGQWRAASYRYRELIKQYPKAAITPKAKAALAVALVKVELLTVRGLLETGEYCDSPAKYSAAPLYRRGVNRALFQGETNEYLDQLPRQWKTTVPTNASVVICTGKVQDGPAVDTCSYTPQDDPNLHYYRTFRKVVVPVKIFALRTGRLVRSAKVVIDGQACPSVYWDYSGLTPAYGSTISTPVEPSDANVRAAFQPLLVRP